ncbi:MAG: transporter substrate-binding domain-containing protein [Candidatus Delongbacteria bacterium]|nr:transporter substrate-binding domain-containing protein [Candidatus Delongbacteria bacterium]
MAFLLLVSAKGFSANMDTVKVGIYQNEPKVYLNNKGQPAGIFVDFLEKIARQENWHIEYETGDWKWCLNALKKGEIDLMPDVAFTVDRSKKFDFNNTCVLESWSQVYAKPTSEIVKLSDLSGKRIVILRGSVQEGNFRQMMSGFNIHYKLIPVKSYNEGFNMVNNDLADAAIANHYFGEMHYEKAGLKKTPIIFSPASLYFATPKGKNGKLLQAIDKHLTNWINTPDSYYYNTLNKYCGLPGQPPASKFPMWITYLIGGLLVIAFVVIITLRHMVGVKTKAIRQTNMRLKEERNKFKSYIENAPYGILVTNAKGKCFDINNTFTSLTGIKKHDICNTNMYEHLPSSYHRSSVRHFEKAIADNHASGTYMFFNKKNEKHYCNIDTVKIFDDRFISFLNDLTERYVAQKELKLLKNRLEKQVEKRTVELKEKIFYLHKSQKAMLYMVEDLNKMTADLKEERRKLRFFNEELEAFTYSVSHDLRAPLRAINGFSNFLVEDYASKLDDEGIRYINIIMSNTNKMDNLISNLLTMSRVSRTELTSSDVDMHTTVKTIFDEIATAEEKDEFDLEIHDLPKAKCDARLIKQVWQNLIANALKYSSKSPVKKIEIRAEQKKEETVFCIKDHGAGFDPKYKTKLFGVFQRLHTEKEFHGTGVGLAIVQRIIKKHGGRVWAEGKTNKGASFYFSLPKKH